MHLAAAFRSAGYRHVIATLWPARDDIATRIHRALLPLTQPTAGWMVERPDPSAQAARVEPLSYGLPVPEGMVTGGA